MDEFRAIFDGLPFSKLIMKKAALLDEYIGNLRIIVDIPDLTTFELMEKTSAETVKLVNKYNKITEADNGNN